MSARTVRRSLAAGVVALALIGAGAATASAADQVPDVPQFGGTLFLADGSTGEDVAPGATLAYDFQAIALPSAGDLVGTFPIPAGAETARTFLAPQGQEATPSQWNAAADISLTPGGIYLPNVTPINQLIIGNGTPAGTNAVKAAGGDYSIGIAFLKTNNLVVVADGLYYVHIHVTPGTGAYTFQQVEVAAAPLTPSTTSLTAPATATAGNAVSLSATVAPAAATGSVEFYDGATLLGTSPVAAGAASLNVATGFSAGSHPITAKYLGDSAYAGSTSAPSTVVVAGQPVATTVTVAATSATGQALTPATITATVVSGDASTPTGSVAFTGSVDGGPVQNLGTAPVGAGGTASLTKSNLTVGTWTFQATFAGTGVYTGSATQAPATLVLAQGTGVADPQTVDVTIPAGSIEITTPYTPANPFDLGTAVLDQATSTYYASAAFPKAADAPIKITDTRSGQPGFTATVVSSDFVSSTDATQTFPGTHLGLTGLTKTSPAGNTLSLADVALTDNAPVTPGLAAPATFAVYPAHKNSGTVEIRGTLGIAGVPTSVEAGTYRATVTFTAF